mgnify:CR=1 FL=1|tara:strand:- start:155 stop:565 length:411 start_codon:yes stop_codon:yes gene_type:complete
MENTHNNEATRTIEEQQGVLSDNMPRYGDGYYLSRYNYGNNPYLFYDTPIYSGKMGDPGFREWQTEARRRYYHDFDLEVQKMTKTMHYHCACAYKALLRNQSQMDEGVIQEMIEWIDEGYQDFKQGGRRRSRRGVE